MENKTNLPFQMNGKLLKRFIYIFVGVVLIGVGIAFMRFADLGTDPFSSMVIGIASILGISFWYAQMGMLALLLIVVVIFNRGYIGIGTLINLVSIGFFSDTFLSFLNTLSLPQGFVSQMILLIVGIVILCFGAALYMNSELGLASYDALGLIIEERSLGKIKFRWARIFTDSSCVAIGFILGSTIGIGTLITAFFTGPLVGYFRNVFEIR